MIPNDSCIRKIFYDKKIFFPGTAKIRESKGQMEKLSDARRTPNEPPFLQSGFKKGARSKSADKSDQRWAFFAALRKSQREDC